MRTSFEVAADSRSTQGKGASRRLRRAGKVPAIIYGGKGDAENITLDQQNLLTLVDKEKFYSTIISLKIDGKAQPALVRDVQFHPAKNQVVHVDLLRVLEDQPLRLNLPIHFLNETSSPGVKLQGGTVSHLRTDIEISCLPKDLPEALELDLGGMNIGDSIKLSELKLPPGVTIPELAHGHDAPVVAIHAPRAQEEAEPAAEAAAAAAATPAAGGAAAAPAAAAKKDAGKK
ncbi:MAG: 50S ribosomal protein L25/general stress protein Ctc [Steroidobacteraceae bacterium]